MKNFFYAPALKLTLISLLILSGCTHAKDVVMKEPFHYIKEVDKGIPDNQMEEETGSIWRDNEGLFADRRAKMVNDIITINIVEASTAKKTATTSTGRDTSSSGGITSLFGLEGGFGNHRLSPAAMVKLEAAKSFNGTGTTERSGNLTGTITAIVKKVYPNGTMGIEGRRIVTVNDEEQYITVTGIIRRTDISTNNTIQSTKIAEAVIKYSGEGIIDREQRPGWLTTVLDVIWPF